MFGSDIPGLARAYQEELLRETKRRRLGNSAQGPQPSLRARFLARVGRVLISMGSKLVDRHGSALTGGPCICRDATGQVLG
jgi:hypothetical protein